MRAHLGTHTPTPALFFLGIGASPPWVVLISSCNCKSRLGSTERGLPELTCDGTKDKARNTGEALLRTCL